MTRRGRRDRLHVKYLLSRELVQNRRMNEDPIYLIKAPNEGEEVLIREAVHDGWRKVREIPVPTDVPNLGVLKVELDVDALVWVGRKLDGLRDDICVSLEKGIAVWCGSKILRRFESSVGFVDGTLMSCCVVHSGLVVRTRETAGGRQPSQPRPRRRPDVTRPSRETCPLFGNNTLNSTKRQTAEQITKQK